MQSATTSGRKPWLKRKDWAARRLYRIDGWRGFTIMLLVASLGLPALAIVIVSRDIEMIVTSSLEIGRAHV